MGLHSPSKRVAEPPLCESNHSWAKDGTWINVIWRDKILTPSAYRFFVALAATRRCYWVGGWVLACWMNEWMNPPRGYLWLWLMASPKKHRIVAKKWKWSEKRGGERHIFHSIHLPFWWHVLSGKLPRQILCNVIGLKSTLNPIIALPFLFTSFQVHPVHCKL